MARQIVGEIYLNVKPLDGGVAPGVQKIIDNAGTTASRAAQGIGDSIEEKIGGAWLQAASQATAMTAAVIGIRRAIASVKAELAGLFDSLVLARNGFNAILGDQAGGDLLNQIRNFARDTPFITDTLVTYSQRLLGVGVSAEKIVPLLNDVGTIIASLGGDPTSLDRVLYNLSQIQSIGRVTGRDLMDLQGALIPLGKIIADYFNVSIGEARAMITAGKVSAEEAFEALGKFAEGKESALENATNTIRGATDQLGESITLLKQDSPFLETVYQDVVRATQAITAFLSDDKVVAVIDDISESLNVIYTSISPAIQGIAESMQMLSVSGLDIIASSLSVLSSVISAFPADVLNVIGRALGVLIAAQAPLLVMKYVTAVQTAIAPIQRLVTSQVALQSSTRGATGELDRQGVSLSILGRRLTLTNQQVRGLASSYTLAAFAGSALLSKFEEQSQAAKVAGDALEASGFGASIGAAFGPQGAVVGAAVGAGYGIISGIISGAREEAERRRSEMAAIGAQLAQDAADSIEITFPRGIVDSASLEGIVERLDEQGDVLAEVEALQNRLAQLQALDTPETWAENVRAFGEEGADAITQQIRANIGAAEEQLRLIDDAKTKAEEFFSENTVQGAEPLRQVLRSLTNDTETYNTKVDEFVAGLNLSEDEANSLLNTLKGISLFTRSEQVDSFIQFLDAQGIRNLSLILEDTDAAMRIFNDTTLTAFERLQVATQGFADKLKEIRDGAKNAYADLAAQVNVLTTTNEAWDKLADSITKYTDQASQLSESGSINFAAERQIAAQVLASAEDFTAALTLITGDETSAITQTSGLIATQLETLREQMGWTADELEDFTRRNGLYQYFYAVSQGAEAFSGSIQELADTTGFTLERLKRELALPDDFEENSLVNAPAILQQKLRELANTPITDIAYGELSRQIGQMIESGLLIYGEEAVSAAEREYQRRLREMHQRVLEGFRDLDIERSVFERGESLGTAIGNFFLNDGEGRAVAETIASQYRSIYESTLQLTGNASTALQSAISFLRGSFELLREEGGMTNEEIEELLSNMGYYDLYARSIGGSDAFVGTISELADELGFANEQALRLRLGLEGLPDNKNIVVTSELQAALDKLDNFEFGTEKYKEQLELIEQLVAGGGALVFDTSGPEKIAQERARQEAEKARQEAERLAEEQAREAERLQREAERLAEEQAREAARIAEAFKNAGETITGAMDSAADAIRSAAEQWVASIKERTQQERAVPIERLLRNAAQQTGDLDELGRGIEQLRARGLSDSAIKALEIDNITDLRQVRRLLDADPSQLAALSNMIGQRDANAELIARREQQAETQATIVAAIIQAAQILGYEVSREQAQALSAQIYLDGRTVNAELPPGFLDQILNIGQLV